MLKLLWRNEDGLVLPLAVVIIAVLTLLGFGAFLMVDAQEGVTERNIRKADALHYAEAGINDYLGHINRKTNVEWKQWNVPIPFEDGFYELRDVTEDARSLTKVIESTGWVAGDEASKRTIRVEIGRRSLNEYAYFSDNDGETIYWITGEKCFGPYHTNGTLRIDGTPTFFGPVTYADRVTGVGSNASKIFKAGYRKVPKIEMPTDNYQLLEKAQERGRVFTGLTRIFLKGKTYDVVWYKPITNRHGQVRDYQEIIETDVPLPDNGVIYVDGKTGEGDKFNEAKANLFISGILSGNLTIGVKNEIYITGYNPTINEWRTAKNYPTPGSLDRLGRKGITYQGTDFYPVDADGRQTNASKAVGYAADTSDGDDMLGLVANSHIRILGHGWFDGTSGDVAPNGITIHAALFSIQQGFGYEAYNKYRNKGIITLRGSLVQQTRMPVGQISGNYGYDKDYAHDPRMLTKAPPDFPEPLNTGWEIKSWQEI